MSIMPKIEERLVRYKTPFVAIMEPREGFISIAMKQPNVQVRPPMRAEPLKVEPKEWGDNAIKVTLANLQHKERGRTYMNLSTQIHGNLHKFEEILHMHQEVQGGMERRSIGKGFAW
jgi:hypothetical protein